VHARRQDVRTEAPLAFDRRWLAIVSAIRDGLVHCTADGRIAAVNETACAMTGFSADELVGATPPLPYWPEEDLGAMRAFIDGVIEAGHGEHELTLRRKCGERFAAILTVGVDPADGSRVVLMKDVSERAALLRRVEEATLDAETARAAFVRSAEVIGEFLYSGELLAGGDLLVSARGPGLGALLGSADDGRALLARYDDRVHPDDRRAYHEAWGHAAMLERDGEILQHEYRLVGDDGVVRWVRDRWRVTITDGRVFLSGAVCDISALRRAESQREAMVGQLERLATVDPLTELFNRRHFSPVLRERLSRPDSQVGIAMVDVDHFKAINDVHGHAVGDHVLRTVARRLRQATRPDDVVARWGGEEFCILLHGVRDGDQLASLAERLRAAIDVCPISLDGGAQLQVNVSVGAARASVDGTRPADLLAMADSALYRAKAGGRNRTMVA
jgi:diguanylate cyclase (GGDEF)-like protein/PAS domain S-box-containing protein